MSSLAEVIKVVDDHTKSYKEGGELLFDLLCALNWDIEGVGNAEDAAMFLEDFGKTR